MLRASSLAAKRKLELRVVALPAGRRPGRAPAARGPRGDERGREGVGAVRPLPRRTRARGGRSLEPRGPDRMLEELRPVFADAPAERHAHGADEDGLRTAGAAREPRRDATVLRRRARRGTRAAGAPGRPGRAPADRRRGSASEEPVATGGHRAGVPRAVHRLSGGGARALQGLDVDEHFTSELLRRAARHLREGNLREPMASAAGEESGWTSDPELKELLAELIVEAGREEAPPGDARGAAPAAGDGAHGSQDPARRAGGRAAT